MSKEKEFVEQMPRFKPGKYWAKQHRRKWNPTFLEALHPYPCIMSNPKDYLYLEILTDLYLIFKNENRSEFLAYIKMLYKYGECGITLENMQMQPELLRIVAKTYTQN